MIGVIHSIDDMPDLDEMIEAKNADDPRGPNRGHRRIASSRTGIVAFLEEVRAYVAHEVDTHRS